MGKQCIYKAYKNLKMSSLKSTLIVFIYLHSRKEKENIAVEQKKGACLTVCVRAHVLIRKLWVCAASKHFAFPEETKWPLLSFIA